MRVLILNGAVGDDALLDDLTARLARDFEAREAGVQVARLRDTPVAYCQGCFRCWTHTPGVCKIDDAGRELARDVVTADVVALVTPSRFGGYSSESKKVLDRTLGMLLPFFRRIDGEVHHAPRYAYPPAFGVLAVLDHHDEAAEATVRALVTRNAINFAAPTHAVGIVERTDRPARALAACDALAEALTREPVAPREEVVDVELLLPRVTHASPGDAPTSALLLIGTAKPQGTSTSESLGMELLEQLALQGVVGEMRYLHRDAHSTEGLQSLVALVRRHTLLIIATPIYIDALPSLVARALEAIADDRATQSSPTPLTVAMILNCGFPESRHAAVARTIGSLFASSVHARWAGALQLGGGGTIAGRPLTEVGSMAVHLSTALREAAGALSRGEAIPAATREAFQEPLMPTALYMAAGDAGWLWTAAHEGSLTKLWRRPATEAPRAPR